MDRVARRFVRPSRALARRFCRDRRGVTSIVYGIVFTFVLLATAIAIDHARLVTEISRDQRALDAALLAATDRLGSDDEETSVPARAHKFYDENRRDSVPSHLADIQFDSESGEVSARTDTTWSSTLLKAFGYDTKRIGVTGRVVKGDGTAEIALVLDNSGSMAGTYIEDLKTAAGDLAEKVFAGVEGTEKVKVGIVPFAASVNVGAGNAGASWMDASGQSSIHFADLAEHRSRFDLFADLGVAWGGCVEVRPGTHAVTDSSPDGTDGDSLFVPMFAPDEPDNHNDAGQSYNNNYIADDGGSCTPQVCTCSGRRCASGGGTYTLTPSASPAEAQARTCKYADGARPPSDRCSRGSFGGAGPNYMCTTRPVLPLSASRTEVETSISALTASGNTNIGEGVAWGWRVLSPSAPFTEGRSYDDQENAKFMVVMTDGQSTYSSASNHNRSRYGAYGYADPFDASAPERLGTTYTSTAYVDVIDDNTRAVCANAKAAGITIFTIAFRLESDPATQALLRECASGVDKFFAASDGDALIQSFQNIGREISKLRIAS
jgi:Flp pilus assembly protein TadG